MSKTNTIFVPAGHILTLTSDASTTGLYYIVGGDGAPSGDGTAIAASATITLGPFDNPRTYAIVSTTGTVGYSIAASASGDAASSANVVAALNGATIPTATVAANDKVIIQDTGSSDAVKTVTAQSIADLAGAGGVWTLVDSDVNFAGVTSVDYTDLTTDYSLYMLVFCNVFTVTDTQFVHILVDADNGASFDTGANYEYAIQYTDTAGAQSAAASSSANFIRLNATGMQNAVTNGGMCGRVFIYEPMNAATHTWLTGEIAHIETDTVDSVINNVIGHYDGTQATNAIRIVSSSGNLSGEGIYLYGLSAT